MSKNLKPLVFVAFAAAFVAAATVLPIADWALAGVAWIEVHREIAWTVFFAAYVAATVLIIPGSLLTLAAGFVFGLPAGVVLVSVSSVSGAACAFLVGRFLARAWVKERISRLPRFRAIDDATHSDGFLIVLLVRLSPLFPFNLTNYGLGLTAVRFRDYFFASWIGMLPGTILYVYLGTLTQDLTELTAGGMRNGFLGRGLLIGGFVATLLLTLLVTRRATQALNRRLTADASDG
jgi:uncharacterized membrane protein YdjX (TVP38/TMEM64 family)